MSVDERDPRLSVTPDGAGGGGGGSYGGETANRDRFTQKAEEYHREQAVRDIATSLEDVATHLDQQARNLRTAARTIREGAKVHILETVVREMMWLNTKLGIDRFFVLYGEFSRNFDE